MDHEPSERLKKAVAKLKRARQAEETARLEVYAAILDDLASGVRQVGITRVTGYTREHIRQIKLADGQTRTD